VVVEEKLQMKLLKIFVEILLEDFLPLLIKKRLIQLLLQKQLLDNQCLLEFLLAKKLIDSMLYFPL
jgi:hypothetical protein